MFAILFAFPNTIFADVRIGESITIPDPFADIFSKSENRKLFLEIPVDGRISSLFGLRRDPFSRKVRFHAGIDFANGRHARVRAAGAGRVSFAGWAAGCGGTIVVSHGHGLDTRYCHLSGIFVGRNDFVESGDVIGKMGASGRATGNHLHFEVIENGVLCDPANHLAAVSLSARRTVP